MKKENMWIFAIVALLLGGCGSRAAAQSSDDFQRWEFAISYSHAKAASTFESETALIPDEGPLTTRYCAPEGAEGFGPNLQRFFCERKGMNGFDAAVTLNLSRYVAVKGNFSGHFKSERFTDTFEVGPGETFTANVNTTERLYNILGGIQLKDNGATTRIKPFAQALLGVARQTVRFQQPASDGSSGFDARTRETAFAIKVGGGLDVRLGSHLDIRLVELNYNPIFAGERPLTGAGITVPITVTGRTAHNFTIGVGVVLR